MTVSCLFHVKKRLFSDLHDIKKTCSFFWFAVNILKPHVSALAAIGASPAQSSRSLSLGSEFTISPISSSTPSEVDPTEVRDTLETDPDTGNAANATEGGGEEATVFRDYANACDRVKNFYAEQHAKQTMEYNLRARKYFHEREKLRMSVWDAIEQLNTLVDDSDPDVSVSHFVAFFPLTQKPLTDRPFSNRAPLANRRVNQKGWKA
jgi:Myo-inositol oxygenase